MQNYFLPSNPALPPDLIVLQRTPLDDLGGFREHRFDFHQLDKISFNFRLNDFANKEVLLFGDGCDRSPLGQQQFFGIERVHA